MVTWPGNGGEGRQTSLLNTEHIESEVSRDLQSAVEIHKARTNINNNLEILNSDVWGLRKCLNDRSLADAVCCVSGSCRDLVAQWLLWDVFHFLHI